jgi:uncharacterized membrane protein YqjE
MRIELRPAPSMGDALERAVGAAQGLVEDNLKLIRAEAAAALDAGMQRAMVLLSAAALLALAWVLGLATAYAAVVPGVRPLHALAGLAAINLVLGLAALLAARTRSRRSRDG